MISTRNITSPNNHLSQLLSLSSSSSSLSSSSSSSNHNTQMQTDQTMQPTKDFNYDLNTMINAFFTSNNQQQDLYQFNEQKLNENQSTPTFNQLQLNDDLFDLAQQQRRNSSFQSKEEIDLNENFNLFRKRFNSVGSNVDFGFNGWSQMQPNLNDYNRRQVSNQPDFMPRRDHRAMSVNYNDNFYYDLDQNSTPQFVDNKSKSLSRNLNQMITNPVLNNSPIFNLNKQNKLNCLNPNCNLFNDNLELVKFACNSCQSIHFMHSLCFKKMQQIKRNSFSNGQFIPGDNYLMQTDKSNEINYNCNNCIIGVLNLITNQPVNNNYKSSVSTPFLNEHNDQHKFAPKTNHKLNKQQSSPAASTQSSTPTSTSLRKKSLCLNNPPLPTPMQSVRESRSPSPINYTNNTNHFNYKMKQRQSAPVNINKNRFRTMSTGSTGSFSASSSFSSSVGTAFCVSPTGNANNGNVFKKILNPSNNQVISKPESPEQTVNKPSSPNLSSSLLNESLGDKLASSGNMFHSRDDWSILTHVPFNKQNAIHIRLEDEGPYGNDETRCFLLSHFSTLGIREIGCVLCGCHLSIYDRFPLIDGTFYVSPVNYDAPNQLLDNKADITCSVPATIANKNQFIYAICLGCLHSSNNNIKCKSCKQVWEGGSTLQIGTMYRYEIFAAFPCCQKRLNCSKCDTPIINLNKTGGLQFFSSYSDEVTCQMCKTRDYHFIKPLSKFYDITNNQK